MQEAALRKRQERLTTRKESFLERCSPRVSPSSLKSWNDIMLVHFLNILLPEIQGGFSGAAENRFRHFAKRSSSPGHWCKKTKRKRTTSAPEPNGRQQSLVRIIGIFGTAFCDYSVPSLSMTGIFLQEMKKEKLKKIWEKSTLQLWPKLKLSELSRLKHLFALNAGHIVCTPATLCSCTGKYAFCSAENFKGSFDEPSKGCCWSKKTHWKVELSRIWRVCVCV